MNVFNIRFNLILVSFRFYKAVKENSSIKSNQIEQFLEWLQKYDNSIQGSDTWFNVSAKGVNEYWECDGNLTIDWKDQGYITLFDLLSVRKKNEDSLNRQLYYGNLIF